MCPSHLLTAALLVAAALTPASAADLTKIDRTLQDEPKYTTPTPRYCLLAFGPGARTLVWLVRDGQLMHVLDSPDGKSPKKWRQVKSTSNMFALGNVWEEGGLVCHTDLRYYHNSLYVSVSVKIEGKRQLAGRDRTGSLAFGVSAQDAPVVHFNGPLTRATDLTAVVGTHGVGPGTFAHFFCNDYPKDAWPTAVIEYPAKDGGTPIVVKVRLSED
jgi:hypothetical protein